MSKRFASTGRAARPPPRNVLVKVVRTTFCLVVPLQFCHKRHKSIFRVNPRRPFIRTTRLDAIRRKRSLFPPPLYLLSLRCMENGRRTWIEKSRERERQLERAAKEQSTLLCVSLWLSSSFIIPLPVSPSPNEHSLISRKLYQRNDLSLVDKTYRDLPSLFY